MIEFDSKMLLWATSAVAAYVVYRVFFASKGHSVSNYEQEVQDILTADKYKVKGRFED